MINIYGYIFYYNLFIMPNNNNPYKHQLNNNYKQIKHDKLPTKNKNSHIELINRQVLTQEQSKAVEVQKVDSQQ